MEFLHTKSRFDNPVSGHVFNGNTIEEYISFVNPLLHNVEIKKTSTKMNIRLMTGILGKKFIVDPSELHKLDIIINLHFIKTNKLIRSTMVIRKIVHELRDIMFDVNMNFSVIAQGADEDFRPTRPQDHTGGFYCLKDEDLESYYQFKPYISIVVKRERPLSEYIVNTFVAVFRNEEIVPSIPMMFRDFYPGYSRDFHDSCWEAKYMLLDEEAYTNVSNTELEKILKKFIKWYDVHCILGYRNENTTNFTFAQSGCYEGSEAYFNPAVAQGFFDTVLTNKHSFDENTMGVIDRLSNSILSVTGGNSARTFKQTFYDLINAITGGIKIKFEGLDKLFECIEKGVSHFKKISIALLLLFAFKCMNRAGLFSYSLTNLILSVLSVGGIYMLITEKDFKELWQDVLGCFSFMRQEPEIIMQANVADISTPVEAFMLLLQTFTIGKSAYYGKDITSAFIKSTKGWDRMKVDFADNVSSWFTLLQKFMDYLTTKFVLDPVKIWEGKYPELYAAMRRVNEFVDTLQKDGTLTYDKGRKLEAVLSEMRTVINNLPNTAIHERNIAKTTMDTLNPWKLKLAKANFLGNGPRVKPVGVLFTGPSQIGKTEWNNIFCRMIAARCLPSERLESFLMNPSTECYNRVIEQEYWDAWADQSIVQIDELGARKDVAGSNNESFESLRLINCMSCPLHAADIESKGMINARPILVAATSNLFKFDWVSLNFQEAFENRYDAYVTVPKDEYLIDPSKKFNFEHCKMKKMTEWKTEFEHLEFWRYDLTIARKTGNIFEALIKGQKPLSAMELKEKYVQEIENNKRFGEQTLKRHDEMIAREVLLRKDSDKCVELLESIPVSLEKLKRKYPVSESDLCKKLDEELQRVFAQGFCDVFTKQYRREVEAKLLGLIYMCNFIPLLNFVKRSPKNEKRENFSFANMHFLKERLKAHWKTPRVYMQACTEYLDAKVGCGACMVCKAHSLTITDVVRPSQDNLWPSGSEKIKEAYTNLEFIDDTNYLKLRDQVEGFVPTCLKMKSSAWNGVDEVPFDSPMVYAMIIKNYLERIQIELAKNTKARIKANTLTLMQIPLDIVRSIRLEWVAIAGTIASVGAAAYGIYNWLTKAYPQSASKKMGKARRVNVKAKVLSEVATMQSATDGVIDLIMNKVLTRCQFRIGHEYGAKPIGVITMIAPNVGVMPLHFAQILTLAKEVKDSDPWILSAMNADVSQRKVIPFEAFEWYSPTPESTDRDIIYFYLDTCWLQPTPNIIKYFVPRDKAPSTRFNSALYVPRIVNKNIMLMKEPSFSTPNIRVTYNDPEFSLESFALTNAYKYYLRTEVGDCGSIFVRYSADGSPERILGFHVSGTQYGIGYSQPIDKEEVTRMYEVIKKEKKIGIVEVESFETSEEIEHGDVQGFTNLGSIKGPRTPKESKYMASVLHNRVFPCKKKLARLAPFWKNNVLIDPMANSRLTYQRPSHYIDPNLLDEVSRDVIARMFNKSLVFDTVIVGPRKLTIEEAIYGIEGFEFCNGVSRSTSPGYPRCMEKPNIEPGTKRQWLGPKDGKDRLDISDPSFAAVVKGVEEILDKANKGIRTQLYAVDFPKDERRSIKKVEDGLTRGISGTSMDYLIACLVEFGSLCEWLMVNRINNGFTVGINAFGDEWDVLAKHLHLDPNSLDKNFLDGDFTAFDGSHFRQIMYKFHDLCDAFYGNSSLTRKVLFEDLMNSIHIINGKVYIWECCLPSGHFLTPMLNCFVNLILHELAFVKSGNRVLGLSSGRCIDLYNQNVVTVVYGDDNLHYVGDAVKSIFNMKEHTISMSELGYVYTDARKSMNIGDFLTGGEVSFLKRQFRYSKIIGKIVAPLSLETITDMIQWKKKKDLDNAFLMKTIETAVRELGFHDFDTFKEYSEKISKGCRELMYWQPRCLSYRQCALENASREEYL